MQSYYPHTGGVEYVVKSVAERLARRRHDIVVLCGEPSINRPKEEIVGGVVVTRWPVWSPGNAYHIPKMRNSLEKWLLERVKYLDVVHFHNVHSVLTIYSLSTLKNHSVRRVLTPHYHGTGHTVFRRILWRVWRRYVRNVLVHVDVVHSVSGYEAQLLARDFGVSPIVVEHGVEECISEISWSPSGYVMYSGRIERYKNIHRLANIVKKLNDIGLDLKLKIFGEGSFKHKLKQYLDRLGVEYDLKPPQPYKEYINHLSKANFFGLLSEKEAYGQTVNEANAIGVPVAVARPWGLNFSSRNRTFMVDLEKDDYTIAGEIKAFLEKCMEEPRSKVPVWSEVAEAYVKYLYSG